MLNRYEEASACTIVTFLAQCVVTGLEIWLRGRDLNPRPLGYEPNELPDCSTPRQTGTLPNHLQLKFQNLRSKISVVGLGRVELPTSRLSGVRSNQLSYRPLGFSLRLSAERAPF